MIKDYFKLTKPGIIFGNAFSAAAGFFLASQGHPSFKLFGLMLLGLSLVIASGCVFNNIFDADIDARMERTKNRAMPAGALSKTPGLIFGTILLLLGAWTLYFWTSITALLAALSGFVIYVFFYTPLKRKTPLATLIGALAGATPPVVGYAAVTNKLVLPAAVLFIILVFWQMPHFYAIGIFRLKDYAKAQIPLLPITQGIRSTKIQMLVFVLLYILATASLSLLGLISKSAGIALGILGLIWATTAWSGFKVADDNSWSRNMFRQSLIILVLLCVIISIDKFIFN